MTIPLSILIPTFNEALNLPDCLNSVVGWADDIWIVDSFSTDQTLEIAEQFGVKVVQHNYEGPARQKNWALDNMPFPHDWVLILDADERVSPDLRDEITQILSAAGQEYAGFYLNRRFIFYGKWIKHCGWYPSWNLRLFKHRLGRYENREVHEHVILNGRAGYCKHDLIHEDLRDLTFWIAKHNRYSTLEAWENYRTIQHVGETGFKPSFFKGDVERKRAIKERIWVHLAAPVRSLLFFFYMYIFRFGFLDGVQGFHFCTMHAIFEYFYAIKLWELKHYKEGAPEGGISVQKVFQPSPTVEISNCRKGI